MSLSYILYGGPSPRANDRNILGKRGGIGRYELSGNRILRYSGSNNLMWDQEIPQGYSILEPEGIRPVFGPGVIAMMVMPGYRNFVEIYLDSCSPGSLYEDWKYPNRLKFGGGMIVPECGIDRYGGFYSVGTVTVKNTAQIFTICERLLEIAPHPFQVVMPGVFPEEDVFFPLQ